MLSISGQLIYDWQDSRATRQSGRWWAALKIPWGIGEYYRHWAKKEWGYDFTPPIWGEHVSIIRGEFPRKLKLWRKYHGEKFSIQYSEVLDFNGTYAWLAVNAPQMEEIRMELGLPPKPKKDFHLTVGNVKNKEPLKEITLPFRVFCWENPENVARIYKQRQRLITTKQ